MDIKQLIENAEGLKDKKETRTKVILEIDRFKELGFEDCRVTLQKPTTSMLIAAQEHNDNYYQLSNCMINPDLHDKELQKAFKVNNASALLKKIFTEEELQLSLIHISEPTRPY